MKEALRRSELLPRTENAFAVGNAAGALSALTRGTVQLLAARACFMVSGYLITVILARNLGPIDYGVYGVIMSVLIWIEVLAGAGVPGATAKLISEYESHAREVEQASRMLVLVVSLVAFSLSWLLAPAFARLFDIDEGTTLFRLAILDVPFAGLYFSYQGLLHGRRQFGTLSISFVLYGLTKLFGILALSILGLSLSGALIVNVLATVAVLVYLTIKAPPNLLRPSYSFIASMLRVGLVMGFNLVAMQVLTNIDLWSLKILWTGEAEVIGLYVAALNLAKVLGVVSAPLSGVLFASLSWSLARKDEVAAQSYIGGACRLAFIMLLPSCVLLALHAESVMVLLYSDIYASSGAYLSLQLIAFGLWAFLDIYLNALASANKFYFVSSIVLALMPISLLLNLALIPRLGAIGAALSLMLTIGLGTTVAAVFAYQRFGPLISLSTFRRVVAATALAILIGMLIPATGPWLIVRFAVVAATYFLLLCLLKEIRWEDLKAFTPWAEEQSR